MVCASAMTRATSSAPWVGEANRARWSGVVDFEDIRLEEDRRYQRTASVMTSGGKRYRRTPRGALGGGEGEISSRKSP